MGVSFKKALYACSLGGLNSQLKPLFLKRLFHQREFHWPIQKTAKAKPQSNPCSETLSGCSQPIEGNLSAPNPRIPKSEPGPILPFPPFPPSHCTPPTLPPTPVPTCQPLPSKLHVLREPVTPTALSAPSIGQADSQKLIHIHSCSSPAPTLLPPRRASGQYPPLLTHSQELVPELGHVLLSTWPVSGGMPAPYKEACSPSHWESHRGYAHRTSSLNTEMPLRTWTWMVWGTGQEDWRLCLIEDAVKVRESHTCSASREGEGRKGWGVGGGLQEARS